MFLVHITNPKSFVFNFWGSLQMRAVFVSLISVVPVNQSVSPQDVLSVQRSMLSTSLSLFIAA